MLMTSTNDIPGQNYQALGLVQGSTVQTVNAFKDIGASFKTLVGGELTKYNEMMEKARALAVSRMEDEARRMGADAIIGIRFSSASIMQGAAEVMAYGTAVKYC